MSEVLGRIDDWKVDTVAVGVVGTDVPATTHGPATTVLRMASITKPLTAYGVLIAARDGVLHLDEPAGPTAGQGATVRHLLAHASGLPYEDDAPTQSPERRRVYSNWGYEILGDLVADRTGLGFAEHLEVELFDPLGMDDTRLRGSPAADAEGTVEDLLAFVAELLEPTLLDAPAVAAATSVAYPGLEGVLPGFGRQSSNDWGLGFEVKGDKAPHWTGGTLPPSTFGHFGVSGSFLWVDPEAGIGSALLCDRDFGPWAKKAWPDFTDAVHEEFS